MATLEDVKKRPDYLGALTDKQRNWVDAYITSGQDKIAAAKASSPRCANDQVAIAISSRNLRHPVISRIINEFFGMAGEMGDKDQCLTILWKRINSEKVDDKYLLAYIELYGRWRGYELKPAAPTAAAEGEPSVDELLALQE